MKLCKGIVFFVLRFTLVRSFIVGECGEFNDTLSRTKEFIADSTFEQSPPFYFYLGQVSTDPYVRVGVVCGPDTPTGVSLVPEDVSFGTSLDEDCAQYNSGFLGLYNEAGQVLVNDGFDLGFDIRTYTPNRKFTHLRFWLARRFANESDVVPLDATVSLSERARNLGLPTLPFFSDSLAPINTSNCPDLGFWRRYDVPIDSLDDFLEAREGTVGYGGLSIFITGVEGLTFAVDNIELVNLNGTIRIDPPPTGKDRVAELGLLDDTTCPASSVDTFTVVALTLVSLCLIGFFAVTRSRSKLTATLMDVIWFLVSIGLAAGAIVELEDFEQKLSNLELCTEGLNEAFANATNLIHAPELRQSFDASQSSLFGTFKLVLPPYDPNDIPSLFSPEGVVGSSANGCAGSNCIDCSIPASDSLIVEKFCSPSDLTCLDNITAFIADSDPEVDFVGQVGVFSIEGEISASQSHWIEVILIAFIVDSVLSFTYIVFRVIIRASFEQWKTRAQSILLLNTLILLISLGFTSYVLWLTFNDPIRYDAQFFLKRGVGNIGSDFEQKFGMFVCPKLLLTDDKTNVMIDLSAVETIFKKFSSFSDLGTALVVQADEELLEISPSGRTTSTSVCPPESSEQNMASLFYNYTCDGDTQVPLLPIAAADQRQDFLFLNVIIGLVLIDFLITLVDVVSLGTLLLQIKQERKASEKQALKERKHSL